MAPLHVSRFRSCAEPPHEQNNFPYGIGRVTSIPSFKGDMLEELFHERYCKYGHTQKQHGIAGEHTMDPWNLQTMLSLKFKDYELGDMRRQNLGQVIGHGTFTADGEA